MGEVFYESGGRRIAAALSGFGNGPGVVLVHGLGSSKESGTNLALERTLNAEGITTLRIDVTGHGASEGSFADMTCSAGVRNVLDALAYLEHKGCTTLGLVGSSFGGFLAYHAAARTPSLKALALKCPVADWSSLEDVERWKERGWKPMTTARGEERIAWAFYEDAVAMPAIDVAPEIAMPTLIVHGDADTSVPVAQSREMAERIPSCMLLVIDGADHRFSDEQHKKQMLDAITDFMIAHMR